MDVTVELALEELKHICSQWTLFGHYLQVNNLGAIAERCQGNDEHCLKEVLKDWLKNGKDPSWRRLCSTLEANGWMAEANHIKQKYTVPAGVSILLKDMQGEMASSVLFGLWPKKSQVDVPRGELLEKVKPKYNGNVAAVYQVSGNKAITVRCEASDVTLLSDVQHALLMAIPNAMERFIILMTHGWLDWGAAVKAGDIICIRIMTTGEPCYCEARVHYVGSVIGGQQETMFGVEITDSKYYGYGTTDGTLHEERYFSCSVGNGLFLSLASVAKHMEWLKSQFHVPVTAQPNNDSKQLLVGARVIVRPTDGRRVRGTVRWVGQLPLEAATLREEVPVYGVETDIKVGWTDFLPEFRPVSKSTFTVTNAAHGKVFIPVSMVEPYDETSGSDFIETSVHANDIYSEAQVGYPSSGQVPVVNEQMLAHGLEPETSMQMQIELLKRFENEKAQKQQASYLQNLYDLANSHYSAAAQFPVLFDQTAQLRVGSTVIIPNSVPPLSGTIKWIGIIPQISISGYVAGIELDVQVDGCTDGVCLFNGVRYFICRPNRAFFCPLGQLVPDHNLVLNSANFYEPQLPMDATVKLRIIQNLSISGNTEVEGDMFKCKWEAGYKVAGMIKILEPMSPMLNYFEYEIINRGERCEMGIGVGELTYPLDRMPGWNINGIGYHADDGRLYHTYDHSDANPLLKLSSSLGEAFGPTSTAGDIMGCGVDFDSDVGYGYVNIFFTRNGQLVGSLIKMKRPIHGLYPLVGFSSTGEKVRYLGHSRRVPRSISLPLNVNLSPWLRSNGVRFRDDGLTVEYSGKGLQLDGHDVGVAQANLTANRGNHYFEMEVLSAGEEGLLAIGFAEPTYPFHLYPASTKGCIAYHTGQIVPLGATQGMQCKRIGCGIQFEDMTCRQPSASSLGLACKVVVTKDEVAVGTFECSVPSGGLYPFVALSRLGGKVRVNFEAWTGGTDVRIKGSGEVKHMSAFRSSAAFGNGSMHPNDMCDHNKVKQNLLKVERLQVNQELEDLRAELSEKSWMVSRHHVTVMEKPLGEGAWGYVKEGKFRGQQVAVKCIHKAIVAQHTIRRVYREICTMAHLHHPNLLLFIAAVLDDQGGPLIITELLDTTLRKAYEDNLLHSGLDQCMDIFRDVASALCYLHELEEPIIHRDVSSANVLLKAMANNRWKAKLSDFGSANWAKEAVTMAEGAIVYTAPEAYPVHPSCSVKPPPQTTKIDVYSYGILLCEVTLREFPILMRLNDMKELLKTKHFLQIHSLVQKCTQVDPVKRPTMSSVLEELYDAVIHQGILA